MALQAIAPAEGPPEGIHSLADISRVHSRLTPQRPALAFEGRTTTYEQLDARASQVAQGLIAMRREAGRSGRAPRQEHRSVSGAAARRREGGRGDDAGQLASRAARVRVHHQRQRSEAAVRRTGVHRRRRRARRAAARRRDRRHGSAVQGPRVRRVARCAADARSADPHQARQRRRAALHIRHDGQSEGRGAVTSQPASACRKRPRRIRGAAGARTTSACSRCRVFTSAAPAGRSSA